MVDTPFASESLELEVADIAMEGLVLDTTGLLHAIDTLHQFHHPVFLARRLETGRLFHEHCLSLRENAMKEGCFDVDVLDIPVEQGSNVEQNME